MSLWCSSKGNILRCNLISILLGWLIYSLGYLNRNCIDSIFICSLRHIFLRKSIIFITSLIDFCNCWISIDNFCNSLIIFYLFLWDWFFYNFLWLLALRLPINNTQSDNLLSKVSNFIVSMDSNYIVAALNLRTNNNCITLKSSSIRETINFIVDFT